MEVSKPVSPTRNGPSGMAAPAIRQRTGIRRRTATISACSRAILRHHGIEATRAGDIAMTAREDLQIRDVRSIDDHLTMTLSLPMPYGAARMTIVTGTSASISLPGMTLSAAIAAAAIGRPVGRLTGHPALDMLGDMIVTEVDHAADADGRGVTILRFVDHAEPLDRSAQPRAAALQ